MFLVCVDVYSKLPEVRVMSTTTASATLDVLREWLREWLLSYPQGTLPTHLSGSWA